MTSSTSSNIFNDIATDAQQVQDKYLGASYPYYSNIKTPSQIGMSDKGNLQTLGNDINGLVEYVSLLVTGQSKASTTGGPLGNKFFLKTGGKCMAPDATEQDRYIYINNVPEGNIPFISSGMGVNFKEFKGLIPGSMSNLNALNPYNIMNAFMTGSDPSCVPISMEIIDISNNKSTATNYVATIDIQNMDPCWFPNKTNPINGKKCNETFSNIIPNSQPRRISAPHLIFNNSLNTLYFAGVSAFIIMLIYKMSIHR